MRPRLLPRLHAIIPRRSWGVPMATVQIRYFVDDVDAAIAFYSGQLGFALEMDPIPPFGGIATFPGCSWASPSEQRLHVHLRHRKQRARRTASA